MGNCVGSDELTPIEKAKLARSKNLEKFNKEMNRSSDQEIKLLLLGTGDSGKSTFLKQMKHSQNSGFSRNETLTYMVALKNNTLRSMKKLISILREQDVKLSSRTMKHVAVVEQSGDELTSEVAESINKIWKDPDFPPFYDHVSHFAQVPSCTPYYFQNAVRFAGEFKPTLDDIIRAKLKTTGIFETCFEFQQLNFKIVDVGGQRAERRKWMHCFTDVRAVIFLAAIDEYNMVLEEDGTTNRMEESLQLFSDLTGSRWLCDSVIVLFLNKSDLFKKKIKDHPLSNYFDDINEQDGSNYDAAYEYIEKKYQEAYTGNSTCYSFKTCALDTDKCIKVFSSVTDDVLQSALRKAGI
eukprot:TRINITY_DN10601_c0_g1_i1.p1 TRINITY_DN10601_c0_g1~~TRINITY_DN10601_c0_g1_i1.p1  ORF type:complete len:353 (-),score=87.62 TRINITY_DN10601_c0_g1_i1:103-1161(-)